MTSLNLLRRLRNSFPGISGHDRRRKHRPRRLCLEGLETRRVFANVVVTGDFNNDGLDDLVLGMPDHNGSSGEVRVVYGNAWTYQPWDQARLGRGEVPWGNVELNPWSRPEFGDRFGAALAAADFNGDGYDDLAIGAPGQGIGGKARAGAVHVLYGSSSGLTARGNQYWHQDNLGNHLGNRDVAEAGDQFGSVLAAGDFNGDRRKADLAIGVPYEDVNGVRDAGAVNILYSDSYRNEPLTARNSQFWHQDIYRLEGDGAEAFDGFGSALASGDFDGDSFDDLAIGVPDEDVGSYRDAGAVHVLYGDATSEWSFRPGLDLRNNQLWTQNQLSGSNAEHWDRFGASLAAGNFDGGGRYGIDDLAVGAPNESWHSISGAGAVNMILGTRSGLSSNGSKILVQGYDGIGGKAELFDGFGSSLAVADLNGDGYDDLVVGVPGEDLDELTNAGVVHAIFGGSSGLNGSGDRIYSKNNDGLRYTNASAYDEYGTFVFVADMNRDGVIDIGSLDFDGNISMIYR